MNILIGSKNQGKIEGTKQAFSQFFNNVDVTGISVSSDVSDEPVNNEIYLGAKNRVNNLIKFSKENNIDCDYFLGVESGITNLLGKWVIINIAVIKDKFGYESWGTSSGFPVPDKYVQDIIENNLGNVMDNIFNKKNLNIGKGGISYLTHNNISRIDLTREAFTMALTQFINDDIWKD